MSGRVFPRLCKNDAHVVTDFGHARTRRVNFALLNFIPPKISNTTNLFDDSEIALNGITSSPSSENDRHFYGCNIYATPSVAQFFRTDESSPS